MDDKMKKMEKTLVSDIQDKIGEMVRQLEESEERNAHRCKQLETTLHTSQSELAAQKKVVAELTKQLEGTREKLEDVSRKTEEGLEALEEKDRSNQKTFESLKKNVQAIVETKAHVERLSEEMEDSRAQLQKHTEKLNVHSREIVQTKDSQNDMEAAIQDRILEMKTELQQQLTSSLFSVQKDLEENKGETQQQVTDLRDETAQANLAIARELQEMKTEVEQTTRARNDLESSSQRWEAAVDSLGRKVGEVVHRLRIIEENLRADQETSMNALQALLSD